MGVTLRPMNRPLGRQPFRPGQWQGARIGTKHTTYIQNNFFGSSYGTGFNYGSYMDYGNYCNHDTGLSKGAKWLLGLGIGTTLLGGILKLFGVGGKDEAGSVQGNQPADNNDQVVLDNQSTKPSGVDNDDDVDADTTVETQQTQQPETNPTVEDDDDTVKTNWGVQNMVCTDASKRTSDISGKLTIDPKNKGAEGEPPKEFTITDISSGEAHVYKFVLTGEKGKDGQPIYKCESMNGQAVNENEYTLITGEDGTPKLVQYEGQKNHGFGLLSKAAAQPHVEEPVTPPVTGGGNEEVKDKKGVEEEPTKKGEEKVTTPKPDGKEVGEKVADALVGNTSDDEKKTAIDAIANEIDKTNIVDFIETYKDNKGFIGDDIIEQIQTEWGWTNEEKLTAQKKILSSLLEKANEAGIKLDDSNLKYCEDFLNKNNSESISRDMAINIDKIINKILEELKPKPGSFGGGEGGGGGAGSTF